MTSAGPRARDAILAKLRDAAAKHETLFRSSEHTHDIADTVPTPVTNASGTGSDLAKTFGENLSVVLGSYEIVDDVCNVATRIAARFERWQEEYVGDSSFEGEILSWAPNELPIGDIEQQLKDSGLSFFVPNELYGDEDRSHAASLSVGLTGVDAAFAGTGSIVIVPGPGKSRVASLLPLFHIALVPVSKIFSTLESWLASLRSEGKLEELFRDYAQLAFITGPSKSADIELNLTLGVHGPREVHAIIFDDRT